MSDVRLFKLIVKDTGISSEKGLSYVYKNIDLINEMGIKIKISVIDDDMLNRATVASLNSKGVVSFPALVLDNGKARNGVDEIKDLFERNKRDYNSWIEESRREPRRQMEAPITDPSMATRAYFEREMSMEAFKRDQKDGERDEEGFSSDGEDFNRRIAENMGRRKVQMPGGGNNNFAGGSGDLDGDMDRRQQRRGSMDDEPDNIAPIRNSPDDIFTNRLMEGVNDHNVMGEY